jgi:hypothetical protein
VSQKRKHAVCLRFSFGHGFSLVRQARAGARCFHSGFIFTSFIHHLDHHVCATHEILDIEIGMAGWQFKAKNTSLTDRVFRLFFYINSRIGYFVVFRLRP